MDLLTMEEVAHIFKLSPQHIYKLIDKGTFPRPIRIGGNSIRFRAETIKEHIDACAAESERDGWKTRPRGKQAKRVKETEPVDETKQAENAD